MTARCAFGEDAAALPDGSVAVRPTTGRTHQGPLFFRRLFDKLGMAARAAFAHAHSRLRALEFVASGCRLAELSRLPFPAWFVIKKGPRTTAKRHVSRRRIWSIVGRDRVCKKVSRMAPSRFEMFTSWSLPAILLAWGCGFSADRSASAAELTVQPVELRLDDAFARRQLLVDFDGEDVTRAARYEVSPPELLTIDSHGYVAPTAEGSGRVTIYYDDRTIALPFTVSGFDRQRKIDFVTEIEPLLTRFGCNSGGCHGKASGQNGFRLSLFGFDAEFDYQALVAEGRGAAVPAAPHRSLLLTKATGQVPHGGGKRIDPESEAYRMLLAGSPPGLGPAPTFRQVGGWRSFRPDGVCRPRPSSSWR